MLNVASGTRTTMLTACGIFLLLGISFLAIGSWQLYIDTQFSRNARTAEGTVVTKTHRTSAPRTRAAGGRSRTDHYEVTFRFRVDAGTFEGRDELAQDDWEQLKQGGPVAVQYLPEDPSSNSLTTSSSWLRNALFALVGLVLTVGGGAGLAWTSRRADLEARLQQHGISAQGTVMELTRVPLKINDESLWRLRFDYEDSRGQRHVSTSSVSEAEVGRWKVGDVGLVRYDSASPAEAIWLGRS
jgi:hypothetical protein